MNCINIKMHGKTIKKSILVYSYISLVDSWSHISDRYRQQNEKWRIGYFRFIVTLCTVSIYFTVLQVQLHVFLKMCIPLYIVGVFRVIGLLWDSFPDMPEMTDGTQSTWLGRETMLYWIPSILAILREHGLKRGGVSRSRDGLNRRTVQFYWLRPNHCNGHRRGRSEINLLQSTVVLICDTYIFYHPVL